MEDSPQRGFSRRICEMCDARCRVAADFRSVLHPRRSNGEGPLVHDGRYLLIWRRVSEDWLIDRYVDRTAQGAQDQPLPEELQ